jgi:hypothetical protein
MAATSYHWAVRSVQVHGTKQSAALCTQLFPKNESDQAACASVTWSFQPFTNFKDFHKT